MNWNNLGIPRVCYAPDGPAGGAAPPAGGAAPPAGGAVPPAGTAVAPWGTDPNAMWMVDNKPWYDVLVPEGPTRDLLKAKNYVNPVANADAYYNANKMLNLDTRISVPGPDAKPEDISAFHTKLGRPANADAYEIKAPEGKQFDPALTTFAKSLAFELGLTPKAAQVMADKYDAFAGGHLSSKAAADKLSNDTAIAALETSWKGKEALETNKAAGLRAIQGLGLDDATMKGIEKNIGAAPLIDLLARIGNIAKEGGAFKTDGGNGGGDTGIYATPEAAAAEITRLRSDTAFQAAYTNRTDPGHQAALDKMEKLYARAGKAAA